jgi:enoyl-CoA hydratase
VTESAPTTAGPGAAAPRYVHVAFPIEHVALVTFDRQDALNALNFALIAELTDALERLDRDPACRCIVLTGAGDRAFAAGADIKELARQTPTSLTVDDEFHRWERIKRIRKPIIAAVRGVALGGGCELAMACDMIVAAEDAKFGQPEIRLGVMPGAGGTQRLTRAIGKAKAMELVLTGDNIGAREAEAKEAVNRAEELSLEAGLEFERRNFFLLFATEDKQEGMAAFTEKRPPAWSGR